MNDMRLWHLYKQKWVYDFTLTSDGLVYLNEWNKNSLLTPQPFEKAGVVPCRKTPLVSDKGEPIYGGDYITCLSPLYKTPKRYEGFVTYTPLGFYLTSVEGFVLPLTEFIRWSLLGTVKIELLGNMFETRTEECKQLRSVKYVVYFPPLSLGIPKLDNHCYKDLDFSKIKQPLLDVNTHQNLCFYDSYNEAVNSLLYWRSKYTDDGWSFSIKIVGTDKDALLE